MKARRAAFQRCDMKVRNSLCVIMKNHTSAVQEDEKKKQNKVRNKAVKKIEPKARKTHAHLHHVAVPQCAVGVHGSLEGKKAKDKLFTCLIVVSPIVMVQIICMVSVCWVWTKNLSVHVRRRTIAHAQTLHGDMLWLLSPAPTGEKRKTGGSKMGDCPSNYLTAGSLPWHRVFANLLSGQLVAIVRRLNERRYMP